MGFKLGGRKSKVVKYEQALAYVATPSPVQFNKFCIRDRQKLEYQFLNVVHKTKVINNPILQYFFTSVTQVFKQSKKTPSKFEF